MAKDNYSVEEIIKSLQDHSKETDHLKKEIFEKDEQIKVLQDANNELSLEMGCVRAALIKILNATTEDCLIVKPEIDTEVKPNLFPTVKNLTKLLKIF